MFTRICIASLIGLLFIGSLASTVRAQTSSASTIRLSYTRLSVGKSETVTVTARDLAGNPLSGAAGTATVFYGTHRATYAIPRTNTAGIATFSFKPPAGITNVRASVDVSLSNGYLNVALTSSFVIGSVAAPVHRAPAPKSPTSKASVPGGLKVVAQVVPGDVTAPAPVWIVVYAHTASGAVAANTPVDVAVLFSQGVMHLSARTNASGVATVRVSTTKVTLNQTVAVGVVVHNTTSVGSGSTVFVVRRPVSASKSTPAPSPTITPVPTAVPTSTPTATPTVTPTPTLVPSVPAAAPEPTLAFTPTPSPTPYPTSTPSPTAGPTLPPLPTLAPTAVDTATPLATATPIDTPTSVDTPTPTATPSPTLTPTPNPQCPGVLKACMQAMVDIINQTRATYSQKYSLGLRSLSLNMTQSNGTSSCAGSMGHSQAMADSGQIWHQNASYPAASFPNNFCVQSFQIGENVGVWPDANELTALQDIHDAMMNEPWQPGCTSDHACNILSSNYSQVGIGIVQGTWNNSPAYYLTEDFIG